MSTNVAADIHGFIASKHPRLSFADDQDIFELGFVNSLFALELVMFLERNFTIALPNEDLETSNFRTVDAMAELVHRHQLAATEQS